jgi:hypothetical protein
LEQLREKNFNKYKSQADMASRSSAGYCYVLDKLSFMVSLIAPD